MGWEYQHSTLLVQLHCREEAKTSFLHLLSQLSSALFLAPHYSPVFLYSGFTIQVYYELWAEAVFLPFGFLVTRQSTRLTRWVFNKYLLKTCLWVDVHLSCWGTHGPGFTWLFSLPTQFLLKAKRVDISKELASWLLKILSSFNWLE